MNRTALATRLLLPIMVAALALAAGLPCLAQGDPAPTIAPQNPAFTAYFQNPALVMQSLSSDAHPSGLIPEPIDFSSIGSIPITKAEIVGAYPSTYDLRPLNKLTPIRDQGSCGSCWDFASMGSLESSLMPTESWNFSENNLKNTAGFDFGCCDGGNRTMSTAYFARWSGPVAETDDPYNAGSCTSPTGLTPKKHVQEVIFLPNRSGALDNDAIKQAVMTYGAVYTTYYHSDSYYNSSTAAYYFNSSTSANHAVCIVGWDDNFPASNFRTPPPGNGAFLIRNSWGTWWGLQGYFWMSYYDNVLGKTENAVYRAETNNYDGIYQYDTLGWISSTGYGSNTAWFANVFTANANSSVVAASWYTPVPNCTYELDVFTNPTSGPINSNGPAVTTTGTITAAGYHTITLPASVPITSGQRFSVVVKLNAPGSSYPIPIERPYSGYASKATASAGQSYISSSGTSWSDLTSSSPNSNVCLKAFTASGSTPNPTPGALSVTPATDMNASGAVGGPFSPASTVYTLTNTGQSSINYAVSSNQSWIGLSATSGTLAAGATANVTISISSSANTLAAGSYGGTVSFTNTTNGTGNTSRMVNLTVNSTSPTPTPGVLSVSPATGLTSAGNIGGPFSPASATYTLANTGQSSLNWSASATRSWVSVSTPAGTLAPGASAMVTVSINSTATSLIAGSYSDVVTFANTSNGSGNTTRPVSLTVSSTTPPPSGTYQVVPATYSWIDPTYHTSLQMWDDSVTYAQYMPFTFTFYGKPYYRLYVGSNGLIGFATNGMYLNTNTNIPSTAWPNNMVCPYWDNLNPQLGGSVRMGTVGTAPNRKFVISWVGVPSAYSTTAKFTFQAIFCEGSNDIIFQYQNVAPTDTLYGAGASATIGIENDMGTQACRYSYNTRGSVSNGMAIRFTTQPAAATTVRRGWIR